MERRELLKRLGAAVAIVPLVKFGSTDAVQAEVLPHKQYLIFFDPIVIDANAVVSTVQPNCEAWLIAVHVKSGQTIDDAVRIYQVAEGKE